jgi:hypothetical protein
VVPCAKIYRKNHIFPDMRRCPVLHIWALPYHAAKISCEKGVFSFFIHIIVFFEKYVERIREVGEIFNNTVLM